MGPDYLHCCNLQGFEEGMFVKGCVLGTDADGYVDLSLRSSDSGWWPGCDEDTVTGTRELAEHPKAASSLSEGQPIKGYVKAVTPKVIPKSTEVVNYGILVCIDSSCLFWSFLFPQFQSRITF